MDAVPAGKRVKVLVLDGSWKKPENMKGKKIKFILQFGAKITD